MATLHYPSNRVIALDGSTNGSSLQPLQPLQSMQPLLSTTGLPWLSSFTPSQSEMAFLGKPYETQILRTSNMPSTSLHSRLSEQQPIQRIRRSSTRSTKPNEDISPERAKHLERNRISANKCRMKKKKEHARMQTRLSTETAKRDSLLSEVGLLKDELWYLKNMIFEHAKCKHQSIDNELSKMTQNILASSSGQRKCPSMKCPSPAFSSSTWSDGSGLEELGASGRPVALPAGGLGYGGDPEAIFDNFLDFETL